MQLSVKGRNIYVKTDKVAKLTKKKPSLKTKSREALVYTRSLTFYFSFYILMFLVTIPILIFLLPVAIPFFFFAGKFYNPFDLKLDARLKFYGNGNCEFDYKYDFKKSSNLEVKYIYPFSLFIVRFIFNLIGFLLIIFVLLYYYFTDKATVMVLVIVCVYSVILIPIISIYSVKLHKYLRLYKNLNGISLEDYLASLEVEN